MEIFRMIWWLNGCNWCCFKCIIELNHWTCCSKIDFPLLISHFVNKLNGFEFISVDDLYWMRNFGVVLYIGSLICLHLVGLSPIILCQWFGAFLFCVSNISGKLYKYHPCWSFFGLLQYWLWKTDQTLSLWSNWGILYICDISYRKMSHSELLNIPRI